MSFGTKYVNGLPIPALYSSERFQSALSYKPIPGDIFLVTYPKCGTTWTGQILLLLLQKGRPLTYLDLDRAPFLEMAGGEGVECMPRPGIIKTHLPFHLIPWSDDAKYIYVIRNPKDCCVSTFHYSKHVPGVRFEGSFDEFFEHFMTGVSKNIYFGDFFDHLKSWYTHRNDPNVLFLTYEEMKEDIDAAIFKMASFIDDEKYAKPMRKNPEILKNIKKLSSLKVMQEDMSKQHQEISKMTPEEFLKSSLPNTMKEYMIREQDNVNPVACDKTSASTVDLSERFNLISKLVRKGEIGDWKNYFSVEQSRRMDEKFDKKTQGTGIQNLWKKYMI